MIIDNGAIMRFVRAYRTGIIKQWDFRQVCQHLSESQEWIDTALIDTIELLRMRGREIIPIPGIQDAIKTSRCRMWWRAQGSIPAPLTWE